MFPIGSRTIFDGLGGMRRARPSSIPRADLVPLLGTASRVSDLPRTHGGDIEVTSHSQFGTATMRMFVLTTAPSGPGNPGTEDPLFRPAAANRAALGKRPGLVTPTQGCTLIKINHISVAGTSRVPSRARIGDAHDSNPRFSMQ